MRLGRGCRRGIVNSLRRRTAFWAALGLLLAAGRLCHVRVLWEGDTLPLAAAAQMLRGKALYREIWFDKPPLVAAFHLLCGAADGWPLRLLDAAYALLACWLAYRLATRLWSHREGFWSAGLLAFFLTFDIPSAVIPVASDMLMLAPHLARCLDGAGETAVLERRPGGAGLRGQSEGRFRAGRLRSLVSRRDSGPGGGIRRCGSRGSCLAARRTGSLGAYIDEVWRWGRLYASSTPVEAPWRNGLVRTVNWLGFHAALAAAAGRFLWSERPRWRWAGWLAVALVGVAMGMRFFPRYYVLLLPPMILMAARGFTQFRRRRELVALLLLIPLTRFGPSFFAAAMDMTWRDIRMDQSSRAAAAAVKRLAQRGDTLLVWGYRPEIFVYSGLAAATPYLDSQPLTGVPADRHLTRSEPVEREEAARRRAELTRSRPTFIVDGLGLYNPQLAIARYPDLRAWLAMYAEVGRAGDCIIYRLAGP